MRRFIKESEYDVAETWWWGSIWMSSEGERVGSWLARSTSTIIATLCPLCVLTSLHCHSLSQCTDRLDWVCCTVVVLCFTSFCYPFISISGFRSDGLIFNASFARLSRLSLTESEIEWISVFVCVDGPIMNRSDVKVAVDVHQSAQLVCSARGWPVPVMMWSRNSTSLINITKYWTTAPDEVDRLVSLLNITSVQQDDLGIYSCTASNDMGVSVTQFNLTIKSKQPYHFYHMHECCVWIISADVGYLGASLTGCNYNLNPL